MEGKTSSQDRSFSRKCGPRIAIILPASAEIRMPSCDGIPAITKSVGKMRLDVCAWVLRPAFYAWSCIALPCNQAATRCPCQCPLASTSPGKNLRRATGHCQRLETSMKATALKDKVCVHERFILFRLKTINTQNRERMSQGSDGDIAICSQPWLRDHHTIYPDENEIEKRYHIMRATCLNETQKDSRRSRRRYHRRRAF